MQETEKRYTKTQSLTRRNHQNIYELSLAGDINNFLTGPLLKGAAITPTLNDGVVTVDRSSPE